MSKKEKMVVERASNCVSVSRQKPLSEATYPFFNSKGERTDVHCIHSDSLVGVTDEGGPDNRRFGVIAMRKGDQGLFAAYTSDELRSFAVQLMNMANYLDTGEGA